MGDPNHLVTGMILQVVLAIQKIQVFPSHGDRYFLLKMKNPSWTWKGFMSVDLRVHVMSDESLGNKTKKIPELGGFHHDSSNNRLQLFFWTKKDRRYENTKPIQFICLLPRLFKQKKLGELTFFWRNQKVTSEEAKSSFSELKPSFLDH